ncbi:hypothetical protein LCGC14_3145110, partial [marine sediment metagenome]
MGGGSYSPPTAEEVAERVVRMAKAVARYRICLACGWMGRLTEKQLSGSRTVCPQCGPTSARLTAFPPAEKSRRKAVASWEEYASHALPSGCKSVYLV